MQRLECSRLQTGSFCGLGGGMPHLYSETLTAILNVILSFCQTGASLTIPERITQDITAAMKARDEHRLSTLRMVKSALKNKEIDKRAALDDQEAMAVLNTLIKQRK